MRYAALNTTNLADDAEVLASWADDCIKSDMLHPSGQWFYLGVLYAFRGFARRVARDMPRSNRIDYLASQAKAEIKAMADEARRAIYAKLPEAL